MKLTEIKLSIIIILLETISLKAQKFENCVSVYSVYNLNYSKTNLRVDEAPVSGSFSQYLDNLEHPKKLFLGHSFGINIFFPISKRLQLGTGFLHEIKGQRSSKIPSTIDPKVKYSHSFILESYQIPIISRLFLENDLSILNQFLITELIMDVHSTFTAQQYRYDDKNGKQKGDVEMFSPANNFVTNIKEKYLRIGIGIGYGVSYDKQDHLTFKSDVAFRYYSDLLNQSNPWAFRGNAYLIKLGLSVGWKSK